MRVLADKSLPNIKEHFAKPFKLTIYDTNECVPGLIGKHDILVCRSTLSVDKALLENTPIKCVATASSGTDHIDSNYLKTNNITLFDAKGFNAIAVTDYVLLVLSCLNKENISPGNLAGVIGVGEVGSRVVKLLKAMGFEVLCFDPYKEKIDTHNKYTKLDNLTKCNLICVHASLHNEKPYPSSKLINQEFLNKLSANTTIINAARGGIVDETAIINTSKKINYCTDVYQNEPDINPEIVKRALICTPHIAGHSIEAKQDAVIILANKISKFYDLNQSMMPLHQESTKNNISQPLLFDLNEITEGWQKNILSVYNPLDDTKILKNSINIRDTFLSQRKAHIFRHNL